ncbi:MAG TPA: hypothetical protein DEA96_09085 [Leptospiraceae bacterium]|nr:hypothetical protein [Spirochaetaceae bacterium]HBS05106.1 hypothetical protein [Leptospiraceae bacterium]
MRTVYLIRHGIAMDREEFRGNDLDRPLTGSGEEKTLQAMKGLVRYLEMRAEAPRILTSPAVRALQTAEIFARARGKTAKPQVIDRLKPGANCLDYLETMIYSQISDSSDEVLLIFGHEPEISETCSLLSNLHRIQAFYSTLWSSPEPHSETLAELQHWLPSDEGEITVVEGSMAFRIKKAGAVRIVLDESGAEFQALLPPQILRAMA